MNNLFLSFSKFCRKAFYEPNSRLFVVVNDTLSIIIIIAIFVIILESVAEFAAYQRLMATIEFIAVIIFSIEYVCRVVGSPKKISYIFSFFGFIDLISIVPTWLHITNLTALKSLRALRILRFLRMLRLAKIVRFEHLEKPSKKNKLAIIRLNLQIYFLAALFTIIILGTLVYAVEHGHPHFENIPLSMLWIIEALLGGSISTTVPQTYAGIGIFMVARFMSYILLGFLIHIIGNVISHFLLGNKDNPPIDNEL